jgi:hypothetical protein
MRYPGCDSDNPASVRFCGNCGAALTAQCTACGADNPPGFNFCGQCGQKIVAPQSATQPPGASIAARTEPAGERRHLTVLFSDLVNSTVIAAQLDPEEWRDTVAALPSRRR